MSKNQTTKAGERTQQVLRGFNAAGGHRLWWVQFPALNNLRFWFERGLTRGSWAIKAHYGLGAGYIGGWTAYLGNRQGKYAPISGLRGGITRNGNQAVLIDG